jgi:hypothetical protein
LLTFASNDHLPPKAIPQKIKLRSGIKLLAEIEGCGDPIQDNDTYDAVLKFYRNQGEPLTMQTMPIDPTPKVVERNGELRIEWDSPEFIASHIVIERNRTLSRGADLLPGIYYSILGMRAGGYRHSVIPPHLFAHSVYDVLEIDRESVIKLECFLIAIR